MAQCTGKITVGEGLATEEKLAADMLAHGLPLAPFPRLEVTSREDGLSLGRLSGLIVKRTEFNAENL